MRGLAVRIAGLALCASALGGCGMMGMGSDDASSVAPHANQAMPIPADIGAAVRQAQLLRLNGDTDGATRILSQLMLGAPDDPRIVGEYGKLLVQENHTGDAVQFLNRAIQLQPADWTLYSALGVAYDKQSDPANAKLAYERGLALKPGEPAILNNYSMSRMLAGDRVAARTLMMQARAGGSNDPRIAQNLALLDAQMPVLAAPVPTTAVAVATAPPVAAAPRTPTVVVASNSLPPAAPAHGAPLPLAPAKPVMHGNGQVMMQDVPVDPLAGPVARTAHNAKPPAKPTTKLAKADRPAKPVKPTKTAKPVTQMAANAPAKPPKTAKPDARNHIPALRMTADASKP